VGSWGEARELVRGKVVSEVDEMWAYVGRPFTGVHVLCAHWVFTSSVGGRDQGRSMGSGIISRWGEVSDDYNVFSLRDHTVTSPVNPNGSLHSSLRDGLGSRGDQGREQEPKWSSTP